MVYLIRMLPLCELLCKFFAAQKVWEKFNKSPPAGTAKNLHE
jgi:hypothetical protein